MLVVATVVYFGLALFDAWFTARRLPTIGIEAEYNPFARWLAKKLGVRAGIFLSVLIPTVGVLMVGYHFPQFLNVLLGCRITLFAFQLKVLFSPDDARTIKILSGTDGPTEGSGLLLHAPVLRSDEERNRG